MKKHRQSYYRHFYAMGTRFDLILPGTGERDGQDRANRVQAEVMRLHTKLSRFLPDSDLSMINRHAGREPVALDREMFSIVSLCLEYTIKTAGCFDISVLSYQDRQENTGRINPVFSSGMIELDTEKSSVFFTQPGIRCDLGGFGKGYALSRVRDLLLQDGTSHAFVSFGESSILALGHHPAGNSWPVTVPAHGPGDENCRKFQLRDDSLSCSSTLRPSAIQEGTRFHLVNPLTGKQVRTKLMSCVQSVDPVTAEVLSTALLVADRDRQKMILNNYPGCKTFVFVKP